METIKIDMRGLMCPSTLLTALREINANKLALKSGGLRLSFLTDNRDATVTIPDAATSMGYEVCVIKEDGCYCIDIYTEAVENGLRRL